MPIVIPNGVETASCKVKGLTAIGGAIRNIADHWIHAAAQMPRGPWELARIQQNLNFAECVAGALSLYSSAMHQTQLEANLLSQFECKVTPCLKPVSKAPIRAIADINLRVMIDDFWTISVAIIVCGNPEERDSYTMEAAAVRKGRLEGREPRRYEYNDTGLGRMLDDIADFDRWMRA